MNMKLTIAVVAGLSLASGQALAADEDAAETAAQAEAVPAEQVEAVQETRWVRVTGSRIYREVPVLAPYTRHLVTHTPMFILTREELDVTAATDLGTAIREADPATPNR